MSLKEIKKRWIFEGFSKHDSMNALCPKCNLGHLSFKKDWVMIEENSETKLEISIYFDYHANQRKEYFTGFSVCSNIKCQEPIAITGEIEYKEEYDEENMQRGYYKFFIPKFFYPSLAIIQLGDHCPSDIKYQIEKSFSHFFNDRSACANAIRTSLEFIMNHQKIPKSFITKNREKKNYHLHNRIELFGKVNKELEPFLLAAKWIGNAGSHIAEINKDALLDGYELLNHCLDEIYEKKIRIKTLKNKAKAINRTKKPVSEKANNLLVLRTL